MQKARYNRISTASQKIERQLKRNHKDEVIYNDVISGATAFNERPKGKELIEDIKAGRINFVSVAAVDRLGRSLYDVLTTLEFFTENNVVLRVDNLGIESMVNSKPNPVFKLIVTVLGNVAEMERNSLRERQLEGIAIAKAKGVYKGRVRGSSMNQSEFLDKYKHVVKEFNASPSLSIRKVAKLTGVSIGTAQNVKKAISA